MEDIIQSESDIIEQYGVQKKNFLYGRIFNHQNLIASYETLSTI
ncbi:MAG: hypothetical protein JWQ09_5205 [Segetibacter sp.]|nr:hypothetical protein [Segetibacter sp.]